MGVPAFYRWLSEKYPRVVQDVLEERVAADPASGRALPLDWSGPNPSGLECDNLYIDMNGIIHPCAHPEHGPQPADEREMFDNVCRYVDRLVRAVRPRRLLYLAVDGVAPRAKMNQQRARRFRAAEEARELEEVRRQVREGMAGENGGGGAGPSATTKAAWDSNVITPGTRFMLRLSDHLRFYIRRRLQEDRAWRHLMVLWSDASVPGEGEHKLMAHLRRQRAQPGYDPNAVHVLHGLDADLIMLGLATHEAHFYICREQVLFGRKSLELMEERQTASGHRDQQERLNQAAGPEAMALWENSQTPLQRLSIPVLREYLAAEFEPCLRQDYLAFPPNLERLIDDIVFLCFFVGNDFLPHLPSLDIRDGGLDFLFNVYQRILPSLGDYITQSGGNVNLSHVDVILGQVGAMEDYVFAMKHEAEQRSRTLREQSQQRGRRAEPAAAPPVVAAAPPARARKGRSAKALEGQQPPQQESLVALSRRHQAKEEARQAKKIKHMETEDNARAALALKQALGAGPSGETAEPTTEAVAPELMTVNETVSGTAENEEIGINGSGSNKRSHDEISPETDAITGEENDVTVAKANEVSITADEAGLEKVDADITAVDDDELEENLPHAEDIIVEEQDPETAKMFKDKVQAVIRQKLDEHARNVEDKVRLHEPGWKDRYYRDKCKADDVAKHGGREHMFRSYVMGLCWVMKYYYDGCPSWKWYYPFHYAPFASDLKNIERFQSDCRSFEQNAPFNPVEQLMAVLPPDSSHAIPEASRWLMLDKESPIIDFYPTEVPVDPNGKAMPWLWVVLLPFINEERLLAAMSPTMTKWSKEELLCNARGMDDGYLYIHTVHPLSKKLQLIIEGKNATAPKTRLTDTASMGSKGLTGSVRPPLSNEIHAFGDEVTISVPPFGDKATYSADSVFADNLCSNEVVVVAFTEPPKLSHKSILLPGTRTLAPVLTAQDKIIRRPRLNRFGGTIANMGGSSNNQSHQAGFGSMNISNYERQLAQQTGRGNQMNQPGMRSWGSLEPAMNTRRPPPPPPHVANPFMAQNRPNGQAMWAEQQPRYAPFRQQAAFQPQHQSQQQWQQQQHWQQQQQQQQHQQWRLPPPPQQPWQQPPPPPPPPQGWQGQQNYEAPYQNQQAAGRDYGHQPQHQRQWNQFSQQGSTMTAQRGRQQPPQQQQSYNFRSFVQQSPPVSQPRASSDVMASLKQQLANTLNRNKRQN